MGSWNVGRITVNWIRLTQLPSSCCQMPGLYLSVTTNAGKLWKDLWKEHSLILSVALEKVTIGWLKGDGADVWTSHPNVLGSQDLHSLKEKMLLHCSFNCSWILIVWFFFSLFFFFCNSYGCNNSCIWQSCQPSISLSVVCHVCWTDTPFGFCMLTSVDKMFIRFIFAKDMQSHYIWYYKILIKSCSCLFCVRFYSSLWCSLKCPNSAVIIRMSSFYIRSLQYPNVYIDIAVFCEGCEISFLTNSSVEFSAFMQSMLHLAKKKEKRIPSSPADQLCFDYTCCSALLTFAFLQHVLWMQQHGRLPEMHLTSM